MLDDARNGRCYLPADWLAKAGIPPDGIADPAHRAALAGVVERLLQEADRYYQSAATGLQSLSFRSGWAVATALAVYRDIGRIVRERGVHAWDVRAVVPRRLKVAWLVRGLAQALSARVLGRLGDEAPRTNLWTRGAASID